MNSTLRLFSITLVLSCSVSHAVDPSMLKLHGHWTSKPTDYRLGYPDFSPQTVACTEKWIVAGASRASEQAVRQGAAQVFNAVSGAWVRKLLPPGAPTISQQFGGSCAIIGDKALIGAPGNSTTAGRVFVFNLTNGSLLMTLQPNAGDITTNALFGCSVAVSGNKAIVGAYGDQVSRGSAFVFDLTSGAQLAKLQAPDGASNHSFATSIAAEGNVVVAGAPGVDTFKGAAYAFDLTTFALIRKIQPSSLEFGNAAGYSVAMHQGKVVLGAANTDAFGSVRVGQVLVVDLFSGEEFSLFSPTFHDNEGFGISVATHQGLLVVGTDDGVTAGTAHVFSIDGAHVLALTPPDHDDPSVALRFSESVAVCGGNVVVVEPHESTQASLNGALYLFRGIQRTMPVVKKTSKGDSAPGGVEVNFATIGDSFINADGEIAFTSTLSGPGSNGGKDSGAWSMLGFNQGLDLVLKSWQLDGSLAIGVVSKPLINRPEVGIFQATLTGTGVTPMNNQAIYMDSGLTASQILRTGSVVLTDGVLQGFTQVVQNRANNRVATTCTFRQRPGFTTAANDTGLLWQDVGTNTLEGVREGGAAGATGLTYGHFTGRVASYSALATYATAVAGPVLTSQAVFQKAFGNAEILVAQKNDLAPGSGTARFSAFLGESSDAADTVLYRASLSGCPAAINEGLWTRTTGGTTTLVMRKGDSLPGVPTAKIAKFISFWQVAGQSLALVQVSGKGVAAANDQALLLYQTTAPFAGQTMVLMRKGDPAPGCDAAKIGAINRVEVEPKFGHYLVLATLAGAPAGTELVLFRGFSAYPATLAEQTLRRPVMVLRKGQLFENQPSKVKSISLPTTNMTASGAGITGLGTTMQEPTTAKDAKNLVIAVEFESGVRQVMAGRP